MWDVAENMAVNACECVIDMRDKSEKAPEDCALNVSKKSGALGCEETEVSSDCAEESNCEACKL